MGLSVNWQTTSLQKKYTVDSIPTSPVVASGVIGNTPRLGRGDFRFEP